MEQGGGSAKYSGRGGRRGEDSGKTWARKGSSSKDVGGRQHRGDGLGRGGPDQASCSDQAKHFGRARTLLADQVASHDTLSDSTNEGAMLSDSCGFDPTILRQEVRVI